MYKEDIKAEKVAEGFISYYNDHPSMVIESLKCLYNILSVERFRRDPIFSARVLYLLKIINVRKNHAWKTGYLLTILRFR